MSTKVVWSLLFEMSANIARLKQDMDKAQATVKTATDGIQSMIALTKTALGSLGIGLSVHGFVSFIEGGIEAEAALHKLNLQTGISVEMLSALRPIAKQSGTDFDTVADMVNKLEKNMLTFAQSGAGKSADAFRQLGYTQAQVKAGLQDMDHFLPEFAKRLVQAGVGGEQAGLAMQLMAKGGAAALPFLDELAKRTKLVATLTTEQVAAAHEFEINMIKLKSGAGGLAVTLANEFLPSLNEITGAMVKAKTEGGNLAAIWAGLKAITVGTEKFQAEKDLFNQVSALLSQEATLGRLRRDGYKDDTFAIVTTRKKIEAIKDEIAQSRARVELLQHEQDIKTKAAEDELKSRKPLGDPAGKPKLDTVGLTDYDKEWNKLVDLMQAADKASFGVAANVLHMVNAGELGKVTAEQRKQLLDLAASVEYEQERVKSRKEFAEGMAKTTEDVAKEKEKAQEVLMTAVAGLDAQIAKQKEHNAEIGKTKDQIDLLRASEMDLAIARLQSSVAIKEAEGVGENSFYVQTLKVKIEKTKELQTLQKQSSVRDKTAEDLKSTDADAKQFGQTVSAAFGRMITDGAKGKDVVRSLDQAFAQLITRLLILKPLEAQIEAGFKSVGGLGGILNAFGFGGTSGAGTASWTSGSDLPLGITPMATGTDFVPHDMFALLHKGESVTPAGRNSGGDTNVFNVDMRGASVEAVTRLERLVSQVNGSIEKRAVMAVNVAYNMRGRRGPLGT